MEWERKQPDLGVFGFTRICREIYRVLLRAILPSTKGGPGAAVLTALLLAHAAAIHALVSCLRADDGSNLVSLLAGILLTEAIFCLVLLLLSFICTALYVFRVASLYCADGDPDASKKI